MQSVCISLYDNPPASFSTLLWSKIPHPFTLETPTFLFLSSKRYCIICAELSQQFLIRSLPIVTSYDLSIKILSNGLTTTI